MKSPAGNRRQQVRPERRLSFVTNQVHHCISNLLAWVGDTLMPRSIENLDLAI